MKIVGVAACTVGIAHTYMAQKAIQDECAARGIECKVEAQGGLGIENELTQEDVDSADLVLDKATLCDRFVVGVNQDSLDSGRSKLDTENGLTCADLYEHALKGQKL